LLSETAFVEHGVAKTGAEQARTVLEIDNLQTHFFTPTGVVRAVDGRSFPSRFHDQPHISTRQYARIVNRWVERAGLDSDWHMLIEFCGLVATIIVDEDGIYDPRHPNDRLLLGMNGMVT
jgi:hypothetical protein